MIYTTVNYDDETWMSAPQKLLGPVKGADRMLMLSAASIPLIVAVVERL
jgi:hypothetical protein